MKYALAILAVLFGLLIWTLPAKSQDCFTIQKSLTELNAYTKENQLEASAWVVTSDKHAGIELLVVWFSNAGENVFVSGFRDGCLVLMPDGQTGRMAPITPQVHEAIGRGKLVFPGASSTPFDTY